MFSAGSDMGRPEELRALGTVVLVWPSVVSGYMM